MHSSPARTVIIVLFLLGLSFNSFSQTHRYVDPSGSNSGDCSAPGSPCQTIDYAASQAATNDVLNLTEGTFSSATLSTRVSVSGRGTGTVVQGITVTAPVSGTDLITIENLTVTSSSSNGITIGTSYVKLFNVNSSNHSGRNLNIDASSSIQNIEVSNCVLNGAANGLWITEQTDLTNLTVLNTSMDDNTIGFYSQLGSSTSAGIRLSTVLVRNCTFNNNLRKGIYAEKLEDAVFENITVDNSGTDASYGFNNGIDINLKWQAYSNITIRNSRVINSGAIGSNDLGTAPENRRSSAITIKARTDASSYDGTPASLSNVTLDGVIIDGLVTDLRFGEMGKTDNDGIDMSTVTVQHCSLANDDLAGLLNEENTNTLTIANNYWGGAAPTGTDIEDYGTSALTSQSGELANEIVDASNNSYATVASAISAGGVIQNVPAGVVSGTTTIIMNVTLITPGAGNLHAGSLTTFEELNVNGADLTLGSDLAVSTDLRVGPSRTVTLNNYNLRLSGTKTSSGEIAGSIGSGLFIEGSGSLGTLDFASGFEELEVLEIDRTTGTMALGSDVSVELLLLANGIITTGANNLNFIGNTALDGSDDSFVNGNFVHQVTGTPVGNTLFFPVGIVDYRPISLEGVDQSATTGYTGIVTEATPPSSTSFAGSSILNKLSTTRYWTVTPSAANVTGLDLATLTYGDEENVSDQANLRVAQFQTGSWFNIGGSGASPISSDAAPPNAIDLTLGDFALGDETSGTNFTEIATVFVDASTGNDSNDGTSSGTPKLTLTAGFNLVQSGGTVNIAAGTYAETFEINQPVTISGTGSPTATSVTLSADISATDFTSTTVNVGSSGVLQDGLDLVSSLGTVNVASGTFNEVLTIGKSLTFNGANVGVAASATRVAESIIDPAANNVAITVNATNVTIDGFQFGTSNSVSNVTIGISDDGNTDLGITNNVFYANSAGVSISNLSSGSLSVADNSIDMLDLEDQTNATTGSIGIFLSSLTGTINAELTGNDLQDASWGIFGYNLDNSSDHLLIDGGTYSGCTKGIEIDNFNGSAFAPSTVSIQNVTMSGFAGPDVDVAQPDAQAGIYAFVGSATSADDVTLTIDNVEVSDVGNGGTDHSGIYMGGFATLASGSELNATITNSTVHDNLNRGIFGRGETTTVSVSQCIVSGNGFNPNGFGYSVISRNSANITVTNCEITNSASQLGSDTHGLHASASGNLTVTDCSISQNGNGFIANLQSGGTVDLSRNYFGSTDEATIEGFINTPSLVDFTPAIGSGIDTDGATSGFQPDLSTLHVLAAAGNQTGGTGRWQEGHDLVDASGIVVLPQADYSETVTVSKSLTFQPTTSGSDTSLDNLVMNGAGEVLTLEGNLLINTAVTLTNGIVNVSSGELRLGTSASDFVESVASSITGMVTMDPRAVGTGTIDLLGVNITGTEDLGNVTIARTAGPEGITTDGANTSIAVLWDISSDNAPAGNRDITFSWRSEFDNGKDMTNIAVYRNGGSGWEDVTGGTQNVSGSDPRLLTVNAVLAFSEWTMAEGAAPLPVELISFDSQQEGPHTLLSWSTMVEINSDRFEVERSFNGVDFIKVGMVKASGNTNEIQRYNWMDLFSNNSEAKYVYYRLKMIDKDASLEYSNTIIVERLHVPSLVAYPNPAIAFIKVNLGLPRFNYQIVDQLGKLVKSGVSNGDEINVSTLKKGVYFLKIDMLEEIKFVIVD